MSIIDDLSFAAQQEQNQKCKYKTKCVDRHRHLLIDILQDSSETHPRLLACTTWYVEKNATGRKPRGDFLNIQTGTYLPPCPNLFGAAFPPRAPPGVATEARPFPPRAATLLHVLDGKGVWVGASFHKTNPSKKRARSGSGTPRTHACAQNTSIKPASLHMIRNTNCCRYDC